MNIAIIGLGVVGRGVYDIITENHKNINVKYVLELDPDKLIGVDSQKAKDIYEIVQDKEVNTVVELIGGKGVAYTFVKLALEHKKNVVTANKALLSEHFQECNELARKNSVSLRYEASVGAAINIIDPLQTVARINRIHKIQGIINGSTNFVLSKIFMEDYSLENALEEAFKLGYLETGSNADLEGLDLLRKINILSMLSYNQYINESKIFRVPLTNLTSEAIDYIKSKKLMVKYIATSELQNKQILIHLEPVVISPDSLYAKINYEENIIDLYGKYHKKQSFIGQGAGRYPTAQAVVYDILKLEFSEIYRQSFDQTYKINYECKEYPFLMLKNGKITKRRIKMNSLKLKPNEIILARIEDDVYERL